MSPNLSSKYITVKEIGTMDEADKDIYEESFIHRMSYIARKHADYIIIGWTVNNEKVNQFLDEKYGKEIWEDATKYAEDENLLFSVSERNGARHCFYGVVIRNGDKACKIGSMYTRLANSQYHRQQAKNYGAYHKTIRIFSIADFRDYYEWT